MNRRGYPRRERRGHERAALLRHLEGLAEERLRRRRAKTDQHSRFDQEDLRLQPRTARGDFRAVGLGVNSPLAARLPLEVLDDVGDVDEAAIDAGFLQRAIEQLARRSEERMPREIFRVARLLADHHDVRSRRSFTEDRLRSQSVQVAGLTVRRRVANVAETQPLRQQIGDRRSIRVGARRILRHLSLPVPRPATGISRPATRASRPGRRASQAASRGGRRALSHHAPRAPSGRARPPSGRRRSARAPRAVPSGHWRLRWRPRTPRRYAAIGARRRVSSRCPSGPRAAPYPVSATARRWTAGRTRRAAATARPSHPVRLAARSMDTPPGRYRSRRRTVRRARARRWE